jgi:hypothetical protein
MKNSTHKVSIVLGVHAAFKDSPSGAIGFGARQEVHALDSGMHEEIKQFKRCSGSANMRLCLAAE